jgi:hypothetical protein
VTEAVGHTNVHTIQFVDKTKSLTAQLKDINLPAYTLYLIDKVVRTKATQGPIGCDNSEVINIELERELRKRHKAMYGEAGTVDEDLEDDPHMTEQEREDRINEKLLKRLMNAANIEHKKAHNEQQEEGDSD